MDQLKLLNKYSIIILSAGSGSRLGKLGKKIPKSLLKIKNHRIIDKILNNLIYFGAKEINLGLGFKSKEILNYLKKYKKIKFNTYRITDYKNNGSVFTLYKFNKIWNKNKKPVIMLHSDIVFDKKFLHNILKSKKKNLIGIRTGPKHLFKRKSFMIEIEKKTCRVKKIGFKNDLVNPYGEVICLNKFSIKTFKNILDFLKLNFAKGRNIETWEWLISDFLKVKKNKIYALKKQNYNWINVNRLFDLNSAKKKFKKN